jgi:hypothetical protein
VVVLAQKCDQLLVRTVTLFGYPAAQVLLVGGKACRPAPAGGLGAKDWVVRHCFQSFSTVLRWTWNKAAISDCENSWAAQAFTIRVRKSTDNGRGTAGKLFCDYTL